MTKPKIPMSDVISNLYEEACPFHDGNAELSVEGKEGQYFVVCRSCGATGPYAVTEVLAAIRWCNGKQTKKSDDNPRSGKGEAIPG